MPLCTSIILISSAFNKYLSVTDSWFVGTAAICCLLCGNNNINNSPLRVIWRSFQSHILMHTPCLGFYPIHLTTFIFSAIYVFVLLVYYYIVLCEMQLICRSWCFVYKAGSSLAVKIDGMHLNVSFFTYWSKSVYLYDWRIQS